MAMKIGEAKIVVAKKGFNEPFCKGVKWGEKYIITKIDKGTYQDFRLVED